MNESIKANPIRSLLSIVITTYVIMFVTFVVIVHGDDKGTLNLLIGFVMGLMTGVMGVYFNSSNKPPLNKPTGETPPLEINAVITKSDD